MSSPPYYMYNVSELPYEPDIDKFKPFFVSVCCNREGSVHGIVQKFVVAESAHMAFEAVLAENDIPIAKVWAHSVLEKDDFDRAFALFAKEVLGGSSK